MRALLAALLASTMASAAAAKAENQPDLLVVLSVDQLSADLFDEYRPHFTGGLARLSNGIMFRNGYQAQAATETCPGHSTILTGTLPARNGIVANLWVDQTIGREDKTVYCAEDERVPGTTSTRYKVSSVHLKVPTLGDLLKQRSPASRNVAIAGKDRSAVMMSGHRPDQRWFWKDGKFVTDLEGVATPVAIQRGNAAIAGLIAAGEPALEPPALCLGKAQTYPLSSGQTVGGGRFAREAGNVGNFRSSPSFDGATLALAAGLVSELGLGRDSSPDILSVGLAATDYVGHAYGSGGVEMCLNMLSLDRELGDFLAMLDSTGIDYAVAMTSDHGVVDLPERLHAMGRTEAVRLDPALTTEAVGTAIAQKLGVAGKVLHGGPSADLWFDKGLTPQQRRKAEIEAVRLYLANPQVHAVFTSSQLARVPIPAGSPAKWTLEQRIRASFDPERSGDLVVILKPWVTPIATPGAGYVATHGSPWDYDRRVPILFWRKGAARDSREDAISTVDIMPTLAAMIGQPVDSGAIDGKCLEAVAGSACPQR